MQFRVGPFLYDVIIVGARPRNPEGQAVDALWVCGDHQRIYIFLALRGRRRWNALLHELAHAWDYHCGPADDAETSANLKANFAQQTQEELDVQGGLDALDRLQPIDDVPEELHAAPEPVFVPVENLQRDDVPDVELGEPEPEPLRLEKADTISDLEASRHGTASRRDRKCCGRFTYSKRIWTGTPRFLLMHNREPIHGWVVDRALYCGDCGVLQQWVEGVGADGAPNGVPIDEPDQVTDRMAINRFLCEHPECIDIAEAC